MSLLRPSLRRRARAGFSLLEMMVAVSLLAVIVLALLAAFQQVQRAFRGGVGQVDVLESGRAVMNLLSRELQEMAPCGFVGGISFGTYEAVPGVALQDLFFYVRYNDEAASVKYAFQEDELPTGVATLYRKINPGPADDPASLSAPRLAVEQTGKTPTFDTNFHRVADGVAHFQVLPLDAQGNILTNNPPEVLVQPTNGPPSLVWLFHTNLPAYVDLEVGILEPATLKRFRALLAADPSGVAAANYLNQRLGRLHLFRQRVPIRAEHRLNP